ncbi:MAG: hypothetical protein AVDCRST_MAG38-1500, partial [uncultured Solirubrobacteraceae bacterium]
ECRRVRADDHLPHRRRRRPALPRRLAVVDSGADLQGLRALVGACSRRRAERLRPGRAGPRRCRARGGRPPLRRQAGL